MSRSHILHNSLFGFFFIFIICSYANIPCFKKSSIFFSVSINYSPSLLLRKQELADAQVKNNLALKNFDVLNLHCQRASLEQQTTHVNSHIYSTQQSLITFQSNKCYNITQESTKCLAL